MGEEVSGYIGRLVPALQAAYGEAWNIEARGASQHPKDSKVRTVSRLASSSNSNTSLLTINVSKFGHLPSRSGRRRLISQASP